MSIGSFLLYKGITFFFPGLVILALGTWKHGLTFPKEVLNPRKLWETIPTAIPSMLEYLVGVYGLLLNPLIGAFGQSFFLVTNALATAMLQGYKVKNHTWWTVIGLTISILLLTYFNGGH